MITSSQWGAWLLQPRSGDRKTVYFCAFLLGSCLLLFAICALTRWNQYASQLPGQPPPFGDFFAIWTYARLVHMGPAADLYDFAALHTGQVALGMAASANNPFPYPPVFIVFLWPLGWLSYEAAYGVWLAGNMAAFVWAIVATCSRLPLCVLGALVAPASITSLTFGQSGLLAAALIVAGLRLAGSRPVLAGILIGLLSYKPQLGLLAPVALVAAGFWPALRAACVTAAGLAGVATLAFGWAVWPAWIKMLPVYEAWFDRERAVSQYKATVMENFMLAGMPRPAALGLQALATCVVAVLIWRCFRRNPGQLATAALLTGTFLATPHALVYDLPMTTAALALFIEARIKIGRPFVAAEISIMVLGFLFPALMMMDDVEVPISSISLTLLFGLILLQERRTAL